MRLLIVSNRLPFTLSLKDGDFTFTPSSGGLVSGISSYLDYLKNSSINSLEYIWIGWPGLFISENMRDRFNVKSKDHNIVSVFIKDEDMEYFYQGFCNKTIWPLFHYFQAYTRYEEKHYETYKTINRIFADKICEIAQDGDIIWIHDYHLMLVPQMVREVLGNRVKIGFFLHIPFPSFEVFRLLPVLWREEILKGILGSDLIGFHTNEYTYSFLRALLRILGIDHNLGKIYWNDRIIKIDTFPMGIDFEKFNALSQTSEIRLISKEIKEKIKTEKIIFSVDRLDYTKGINNRLLGFEEFLKNNPEHHKKITFYLLLVPSRIAIDRYRELKDEIDKKISQINSTYGTVDWQPIIYLWRHVPVNELVATYLASDICLITPLRDGMNLVAKEYIAAKSDYNGVLILSEMAGSAKELIEAILVNPNSAREISEALKKAITMNHEEKRDRLYEMQKRLKEYSVISWAKDFICDIEAVYKENNNLTAIFLSEENLNKIIKDFQKSTKSLIISDYDGTLVNFTEDFTLTKPDQDLLKIIKDISEISKFYIVTGRPIKFVDDFFKDLNIGIIAEHGSWIKESGGAWNELFKEDTDWKNKILPIIKRYENRLPNSVVEEKSFSLGFHYRRCDPEMANLRIHEMIDELINYTANMNLQILKGNKIVEIRSYSNNKGAAISRLFVKDAYDFIFFAGDDTTDEDVFKFLKDKNAHTIKVGYSKNTAAKYIVKNPAYLRNFFKKIIKKRIIDEHI
ncbi:MAG: bifunctional alpha,alpha-trehalose-phosphate synthase (UDP-forming)/trehalose-phosphatase [Elusimicrobia bacterium]|nr:bifunctional alpha,alpha-trehalose-phosphate synthase (UDP-forming)/trehalose-phosphatase [Elusimicrobiota bacterium]